MMKFLRIRLENLTQQSNILIASSFVVQQIFKKQKQFLCIFPYSLELSQQRAYYFNFIVNWPSLNQSRYFMTVIPFLLHISHKFSEACF